MDGITGAVQSDPGAGSSKQVTLVPALIMDAADTLCDSLFRWLENRKECAEELEKLAQELEDQSSKIVQVVGASVSAAAALTSVYPGLPSSILLAAACTVVSTAVCPTSTLVKAGVYSSTFNKVTELINENEKAGRNIQKQLRDLKDRCGETQKDRCGGAPLGTHADELDCEVTTLLMWALARRSNTNVPLDFLRGFNRATFFRHMTPGGLAPAEASDYICQALGLDRSPEITSSLKVSAKEMMKNIELTGTIDDAEAGSREQGATGVGISLYDLIVKTEELVKGNRVTEASKILRDSARQILDGQQKLKEQLDAMHEIIQKLFRMKNLINNLGGYSPIMIENGQKIMDYIIGICTDSTVVSLLKEFPNKTHFVNVLRFCLERLSHTLPDLDVLDEKHLDIVIVGHGRIDDQFMPAGVLVPTPYIRDTILYSPWNCAIDAKAAFAIAQGNIQVINREFNKMAYYEPNPLPVHWNSMRRSLHDIPEILQSLHNVPDIVRSIHNIPEIFQSLQIMSEILQSLHNIPGSLRSLHNIPEILPSLHNISEILPSLHNIPEFFQSLHNIPEILPSLHNIPEILQSLHKIPEILQSLHNISEILPSLHKIPEILQSLYNIQEILQSRQNIPGIHLSPVTPTEDAWALFQQFWVNSGVESGDRVIIPYLDLGDKEKAFGEIPLCMFIFAISYILSIHGKTATVHLAACLGRGRSPPRPGQWVTQYAYTSDGTCMSVNLPNMNMNSMLFYALSSLFDRNRR